MMKRKPSKKAVRIAEKYGMPLPPFRHQLREFLDHRDARARALLWSMRTGKSRSIIDLAAYNFLIRHKIDGVLVIAPNGVHDNWIRRQMPEHAWADLGHQQNCLVWRMGDFTSEKKLKAWQKQYERNMRSKKLFWLSVNSESMIKPKTRKLLKDFTKRRKFLLVVDESDDFRTPGSKRTAMARALKRRAVMRRILTGTIVGNSPLAAYSQFELLDDGALGFDNFGTFKNTYAEYAMERPMGKDGKPIYSSARKYPVFKRFRRLDDLRERMAEWATVVLREDCEDLPRLMRTERTVVITSEQRRIYKKLHREFVVAIKNKEVSIGENTMRLIKLQQVLSGFLIDEWGDVHDIPGENPKLEALSREVAQTNGPVVVWAVYHEDIRRIVKRLKAEGRRIGEYHGLVSNRHKTECIDDFQSGRIDTIVGHPKAGGRGLDFSATRAIIYYSHTFDAIVRQQSEERGTKAGGHDVAIVDLVVPDSTDTYIRNNVRNKVDISTKLAGKGLKELLESTVMD